VIKNDLPINCVEVSLEKDKEIGAMGVFESKYGDRVKVYSVGASDCPSSCEICSGPHVQKTGDLGHFKILKEEASSSGVRRIKAILE
jgi:alanyl-tRNA synthetase